MIKMKTSFEKVRFFLSSIPVLMLIFLCGCGKLSHNGDLDGQWEVMQVLDGGTQVEPPADKTFYYNFYLHTFQLSFTGNRSLMLTGNMAYSPEEDRLGLELGFVKAGRVHPSLIALLRFWGIPESGEVVMHIDELTSSRLVMSQGDVTVVCRKF